MQDTVDQMLGTPVQCPPGTLASIIEDAWGACVATECQFGLAACGSYSVGEEWR